MCETLLNKNIPNENIFISGYSPEPLRDTRNGGVCLYFKERCDEETIVAEIKLNRMKIFFVLSDCHPNLSSAEFKVYTKSLEYIYGRIRKENPLVTGDFNARSPLFWGNDIEDSEGRVFNNFFISNISEELINEPTHIRDDGSQCCTHLILSITLFTIL